MKKTKHRELARVYVEDDGTIETRVFATWQNDPDNIRPARLSQAIAEAIMRVIGGEETVREFRHLNRLAKTIH